MEPQSNAKSPLIYRMMAQKSIDVKGGTLSIFGVPAMAFPINSLILLNQTLSVELGDKAQNIMFNLGKLQAKMGVNILYKKMGFKRCRKTFEICNQQGEFIGTGMCEFVKCDAPNKHFIIRYTTQPYATQIKENIGIQKEAVDHFIRGTLSGAYCVHTDDDTMVAIETECVAKGDKTCVFEIKPAANWDLNDPIVKSQFPEDIETIKNAESMLGLNKAISKK